MAADLQPVAFPARRYRLEVAALFSLLVLFAIVASRYQWLQAMDHLYYDLIAGAVPAPLDERLVIVGIDEQSLTVHGRWPWSRTTQAELIEQVIAQQPAALFVDIVYASASTPADDARLLAAFESADTLPIALPVIIDSIAVDRPPIEILPEPDLLAQVDVLGHVHVELDRDSISRGTYLYQGVGDAHWPHVALALAERLQWLPATEPACADAPGGFSLAVQRCRYRYVPFAGPPGTIPQRSALDLLEGDLPARSLAGKVVFLGLTAAGVADWVTSPVSGGGRPIAGVEYNANLFNAIIQQRLIEPAPGWLVRLLCGLFAALAAVLLPRLAPKPMLLVSLLLGVLPFVVSALSQIVWQAHLPLAAAALAAVLAYPFWSWRRHEIAWRYIDQEMDRIAASKDAEPARRDLPSPAQRWQPQALRAASLLGLQAVTESTPVVGTGIEFDPGLRGVTLFLGDQGAVRLQRAETGPPLSERERQLLQTLFAELVTPAAPMPELPGESLAARIRILRNRNRAVQLGRETSMQALEKMNSGVAVISALGDITLANSQFATMTAIHTGEGNVADPAFREQLSLSLPPPIGRSWLDTWRDVVVDSASVGFESKLEDGRLVYVSCAPLEADEPGTWLVICTDVTEITTAQNMREEALAFLSHDLRSPILSVLALVRRGEMDDTARQIERYASKSLTVSEQFLQLSRLESQPRVETYELDVISVLQNAIDQVYTQASDRAVQIDAEQLSTLPDVGVLLMGNGELLERAFVNLLSNAVKYSDPNDRVEVTATVTGNVLAVSFKDQGAGIPAQDLPRLFDPYFRSTLPELARRRGAGLGLRFTKTVIERHGGTLDVASTLGQGSTFVVQLPCAAVLENDSETGQGASADNAESDVQ